MCLRVEGGCLCAHLIYNAPECPDVRMRTVLLGLANLRRHVERRADVGRRKIVGLEDLGQTEVAQLDTVVIAKEDCKLLAHSQAHEDD
jgi:hypothetical protein